MTHRFLKKIEGVSVPPKLIANNSTGSVDGVHQEPDYNPNMVVYRKMEAILESMQDEYMGIPVRTVKSFVSKIPSVFTGASLVSWIAKHVCNDDMGEALHLAHLIAAHGYLFPIDDHILTAKNDNTYYRFQTPCFWLSKCGDPENTDYAVYLCKRTMQNKQRLELADYEAENLARLQKMFSRKWEFIFMQAEAQAKVDKKRDKMERKILDSQERAFWDLHRPAPGCVNTTEVDIKKACRMTNKTGTSSAAIVTANKVTHLSETELTQAVDRLKAEIHCLQSRLEKRRIKVSKCAESFQLFFEQYAEYDPFITTPEPSNPWIADSTEFWEQESCQKEIPQRRVRKWAFSIQELLQDAAGREHFARYLEREFSKENLMFWEACQELKWCPERQVKPKVLRIYSEFLAQGAREPVNVDGRVADLVRTKVENNPSRWCFDEAEEHIFKLMRNDTYNRYLRSDLYKEFVSGTKKKSRFFLPRIPSLNLGGGGSGAQ